MHLQSTKQAMNEYLLFIDTETSGIPDSWKEHDIIPEKWPYIVQIAWIIFDRKGNLIRTENHFINEADISIDPESFRIHGISREKLKQEGQTRKQVLEQLASDLEQYTPLLVGHFIEFDIRMLSVGFKRISIDNPLKNLPVFCTMTTMKLTDPVKMTRNYPRLDVLYEYLFGKKMIDQHNALTDARATSECFFEMIRQDILNDETIDKQQRRIAN